jgi:hypothetical protein
MGALAGVTMDIHAVFGCVSRSIVEGLICQLCLACVLGIGSFYILYVLLVVLFVSMVIIFRWFFDQDPIIAVPPHQPPGPSQ